MLNNDGDFNEIHLSFVHRRVADAIPCYKFLAVFLLNSPVFLSKHTGWHSHRSYLGCLILNYALQLGNNDSACKYGSGLRTPIQITGKLNILRTQLVRLCQKIFTEKDGVVFFQKENRNRKSIRAKLFKKTFCMYDSNSSSAVCRHSCRHAARVFCLQDSNCH